MSSGGLAGLPLGLLCLRARDCLMEFEFHHSILLPAQARLSTSTQLGPGGLWQLGARSLAGLQDWLSSAPGLPRHTQPGCAVTEPHHLSTGHQTLPGAHSWDQQLWWRGRASSLQLLLSSRGQGCQPGPEEQPLLLQLLPPLSPCAKRESLLPGGRLGHVGLLLFFTCCVLAVGACLSTAHRLLSWHTAAQGCPAVLGITDCHPGNPLPATCGVCGSRGGPAVASNLFSQRCSVLCRFI